jgi:hypothetical protein
MNKYKVYGDKLIEYYTVVTADSAEAAWEFAANNDNLDWFQIENDRTIEPYHIQEELEDTLDLIEDDYPSMDSGVIVQSDNSDK